MGIDDAHFHRVQVELPYAGISAYRVRFETHYVADTKECQCTVRKAHGRVVVIDPSAFDLRLYPFYELIHRSWRPGTRNFVREDPSINLGTSIRQFVYDEGGPELKDLSGSQGKRVRDEVFRCIFACNTLQAGFVRGNGFIIAPASPGLSQASELIRKPSDAPGRYEPAFWPLGPPPAGLTDSKFDGKYETMVIAPIPEVRELEVRNDFDPKAANIRLAFSSPAIIRRGYFCFDEIEVHDNPPDANDPTTGRGTIGNEVNWYPSWTGSSFTAFGCKDHQLVVASMFQQQPGRNCGILVGEMAYLLKEHFGVSDAVIGGGSADTQQFLRGDAHTELLVAGARPKVADEKSAPEVIGDRGLGAIFAVLKKSQNGEHGA
jgi:hypothetical protein